MPRNRLKVKLLSVFLLCVLLVPTHVFAQRYREPSEGTQPARRQQQTEVYHESALRRFEIVTLVSLPFTAIHSFLVVRGVKMIRQNEFAPELSSTDFKIVGASAVSFALFIGFWDWLHTHDKVPSQQLMPTSPSRRSPSSPTREVGAADWEIEDTPGFVLPLVQVRF